MSFYEHLNERKGSPMRVAWMGALLALVSLIAPPLAAAQSPNCLVSLSSTDGIANRGGSLITAQADASGFCSFTLTACVNDAPTATCPAGQVTQVKLVGASDLGGLTAAEQSLQAQLPSDQKQCASSTVKVGQTLHRRIRAIAMSEDGRRDTETLLLSCQCPGGTPFTSTWQGIQKVIFEQHGCTQDICHGSAKQGGLDLRTDAAYQNLLEVASTESHFNRVQPGDQNRSYLWLKVAAKTDPTQLPEGVQIAGAPMPNNDTVLSQDELDALRLWIFSGAPQTGTVGGTETLLNACLPPPEPITIKPLDPPPAGAGVQFVMPPWHLEAHSEHEICFATYYDISSQVPPAFQDPTGTMFRFAGNELRQDPQSHHLILNRYIGSAADIHDPTLGTWTCNGGPKAGQTCEPTDPTACGSGICTSAIQQSFACIGFGPQTGTGGSTFYAIGGAQKAQSDTEYPDGVFAQIPMKGILYWNSHAFNLTDQDTTMHARLNYYFAQGQTYPVQSIFDTSHIFSANAAPFSTQTICNDFVLPQGALLFNLSSHTHKHGKHFTVSAPNGAQIYENFIYNDPATQLYDPPMVFDSPTPAQRTLHYCSFYNNGVAADNSPDPTTVTRYSRLPISARQTIGNCKPKACVSGKIGAACNGVGDDHTCDSTPGANDGLCDACRITGGESTENEMFILIGNYYLAGGSPGAASRFDAAGRSLATDVILPPQMGCSASHASHARMMHSAHAGH